jgi:hypothetical protein
MPNCPQCSKPLREFSRRCPSCQADLDLLVDFASSLTRGLERAETFTREGELGKAFWAYLEVLEADPDNVQARRQIGQVVTAVRQFDRVAPGRRWVSGLEPNGLFQPWLFLALATVLIVLAFAIGFVLGHGFPTGNNDGTDKAPPQPIRPAGHMGNK